MDGRRVCVEIEGEGIFIEAVHWTGEVKGERNEIGVWGKKRNGG